MISKALPGQTLIITGIILVLSIMLQCISDPATGNWGTDGDVTTENNYSYIRTVVQDTAGKFYALANRRIITFDEYDFMHNLPPDTLPLPYDTLQFFYDAPGILLDAYGRLVIITYNRIYLVQIPAESVRLTMLIETDSEIRFINVDHGKIMAATQSGDIYGWDGYVIKKYGNLPGITGTYISGIFTDSNKTDVFTTSGCSTHHFTIDGSDSIAQPDNADFNIPRYVFKINGKILAGGNSCTNMTYRNELFLFHLRPDNTIGILDTIPSNSYKSLQTADAVYLQSSNALYKITDFICYRSTFSRNLADGSLFLDRHGRAALLYTTTRRIFILDSLAGYVERARW